MTEHYNCCIHCEHDQDELDLDSASGPRPAHPNPCIEGCNDDE